MRVCIVEATQIRTLDRKKADVESEWAAREYVRDQIPLVRRSDVAQQLQQQNQQLKWLQSIRQCSFWQLVLIPLFAALTHQLQTFHRMHRNSICLFHSKPALFYTLISAIFLPQLEHLWALATTTNKVWTKNWLASLFRVKEGSKGKGGKALEISLSNVKWMRQGEESIYRGTQLDGSSQCPHHCMGLTCTVSVCHQIVSAKNGDASWLTFGARKREKEVATS